VEERVENAVIQEKAPQPDDEIDVSPFFEYLKTDKGHEVATRVLDIFNDIKQATLAQATTHLRIEKWIQLALILAVVIAATILTLHDKFNPTIGVLFGTLVGYVFGRRK
jgi:hypothetical protein